MHRWIAIVIGFANDTAIDRETMVGQTMNPWKTGMGADETDSLELIQPGAHSGIVQFRFVEKFVCSIRAAVAEQDLSRDGFNQRKIRPKPEPSLIFRAQAVHGVLMGQATVTLVFSGSIVAPALIRPGRRLLFVIAGNADGKIPADQFENLVTVATAARGIADESQQFTTL